jgi:hypothetical protein
MGFAPLAGGIKALMPHVDALHACHSLDSLADLAKRALGRWPASQSFVIAASCKKNLRGAGAVAQDAAVSWIAREGAKAWTEPASTGSCGHPHMPRLCL